MRKNPSYPRCFQCCTAYTYCLELSNDKLLLIADEWADNKLVVHFYGQRS